MTDWRQTLRDFLMYLSGCFITVGCIKGDTWLFWVIAFGVGGACYFGAQFIEIGERA